ncbi:MAG: serine/threonine-protein kinase, partial [Acidobacteriota bacterium]
ESLPYYAMEYVQGPDIVAHCDHYRLGLRQRVELFLQVCAGVQHAHQKGLIHRDLKPGNMLVKSAQGQAPMAKIIDFGVAKSLQRKLSFRAVRTQIGSFVGTPLYSSPEQIAGRFDQTDTRSDLYSLGVVLYELLVGKAPFDPKVFDGKGQPEIVEWLRQETAPRPAERFAFVGSEAIGLAERRSSSVDELARQLRGDLSWIVGRCLEHHPDDRYPSVLELAKDLRRWLDDRPVEARRGTSLYRIGKLVRRHRTAVGLAAAVVLTLLATTSVAVVGFLRAERAADEARRIAEEAEIAAAFQTEQLRTIDPAAMGIDLQVRLLDASRRHWTHQGLPEQAIYEREAHLQTWLAGLGFTDLAFAMLDEHLFEQSRRVIDEQYGDWPLLQARLLQSLADTLADLGRWREALKVQDRALAVRREALGPDDPLTLVSLRGRGTLNVYLRRMDAAEPDLVEALSGLRASLGSDHPETLSTLYAYGRLRGRQGRAEASIAAMRDVLAGRRRALGDEHPETLDALNGLAASLIHARRYDEAETHCRAALEGRVRVLGEDHVDSLASMNNMAALWRRMERFVEAEPYARRAVAGARRTLGTDHPNTWRYTSTLGRTLSSLGRHAEALDLLASIVEAQALHLGERHLMTTTTRAGIAAARAALGDANEATRMFRRLADHPDRSSAIVRQDLQTYCHLAEALADAARPGAVTGIVSVLTICSRAYAEQTRFETARDHLETLLGLPGHEPIARHGLASLYDRWHEHQPDRELNREAARWRLLAEAAETSPIDPPTTPPRSVSETAR